MRIILTKVALVALIILHYVVFVSFILSMWLSFFVMPWYLALSLSSLIARVLVSSGACPLTLLENKLRTNLHLHVSKSFLKDYILNIRQTMLDLWTHLK